MGGGGRGGLVCPPDPPPLEGSLLLFRKAAPVISVPEAEPCDRALDVNAEVTPPECPAVGHGPGRTDELFLLFGSWALSAHSGLGFVTEYKSVLCDLGMELYWLGRRTKQNGASEGLVAEGHSGGRSLGPTSQVSSP